MYRLWVQYKYLHSNAPTLLASTHLPTYAHVFVLLHPEKAHWLMDHLFSPIEYYSIVVEQKTTCVPCPLFVYIVKGMDG